ncbi:Bifunctional nuclease 1 [Camellia lanceoleosa]|uniref:Bifunctional nuclease 1 n=1 Tax=Camellia lanceoleosa TaxID=1840588 RepID=A0ACC0INW4_9ERIC|nr:Bifunctional nuclease 1 [Camellia lanceoleosa]
MASNNKKEEPNMAPQPDRWFNLTLGSSFKDHYPSSKFFTLHEFKPTSIDKNQARLLHKNKENRVTVEFHNNQPRKPKVTFEGSSEDYKENDAVLFFDGESFWLERLHRAVKRLRHVRLPSESGCQAVFHLDQPWRLLHHPPSDKFMVKIESIEIIGSKMTQEVKSMLDPCEDENDDIQDDDVSLGADFVQRDEHSESVSEISSRIVMIMDDMVDEAYQLSMTFQARPTMYQVVKEMVDKMGYAVKVVRVTKRVHEAYFAQLYLTKAYSSREGINAEQFARDLKSFELKMTFEDVFPAKATIVEEYLQQFASNLDRVNLQDKDNGVASNQVQQWEIQGSVDGNTNMSSSNGEISQQSTYELISLDTKTESFRWSNRFVDETKVHGLHDKVQSLQRLLVSGL